MVDGRKASRGIADRCRAWALAAWIVCEALLAAVLFGCASDARRTEQPIPVTALSEAVTYLEVPLGCSAVRGLGCVAVARPFLMRLEGQPVVAEAWLNRSGTVLAMVWKDTGVASQRAPFLGAVLREKRGSKIVRLLSGPERQRAEGTFASRAGWYRAADLNQLSKEEAEVIGMRLVRRVTARIALTEKKTAALQAVIVDILNRRFLAEEADGGRSALTGASVEIVRVGRSLLAQPELAALEDALALGFRPVGNENLRTNEN